MLLSYFQYAFLWAVNLTFAAAGYFPPDLVVRNPSSSAASQRIARRALLPPTVIRKREVFESERFTLQKSWEDAVLFSQYVMTCLLLEISQVTLRIADIGRF